MDRRRRSILKTDENLTPKDNAKKVHFGLITTQQPNFRDENSRVSLASEESSFIFPTLASLRQPTPAFVPETAEPKIRAAPVNRIQTPMKSIQVPDSPHSDSLSDRSPVLADQPSTPQRHNAVRASVEGLDFILSEPAGTIETPKERLVLAETPGMMTTPGAKSRGRESTDSLPNLPSDFDENSPRVQITLPPLAREILSGQTQSQSSSSVNLFEVSPTSMGSSGDRRMRMTDESVMMVLQPPPRRPDLTWQQAFDLLGFAFPGFCPVPQIDLGLERIEASKDLLEVVEHVLEDWVDQIQHENGKIKSQLDEIYKGLTDPAAPVCSILTELTEAMDDPVRLESLKKQLSESRSLYQTLTVAETASRTEDQLLRQLVKCVCQRRALLEHERDQCILQNKLQMDLEKIHEERCRLMEERLKRGREKLKYLDEEEKRIEVAKRTQKEAEQKSMEQLKEETRAYRIACQELIDERKTSKQAVMQRRQFLQRHLDSFNWCVPIDNEKGMMVQLPRMRVWLQVCKIERGMPRTVRVKSCEPAGPVVAGNFVSWPSWALSAAFNAKLNRDPFPSTPETLHDAFSVAGVKARELEALMAAFEEVEVVMKEAEARGMITSQSTGICLTVTDGEAHISFEATTTPLSACASCGFSGLPKRLILSWPQSLLGAMNYTMVELNCDFGFTRKERTEIILPALRQVKEALQAMEATPSTAARLVKEVVSRILPAVAKSAGRLCGC